MSRPRTLADRIAGGTLASGTLLDGILPIRRNNLIERPWGGLRLLDYKGLLPLPDQRKLTGLGVGEAFEVAACPSDPEARAYPSTVLLPDGSAIALTELLALAGPALLGRRLHERCGGEIPLLPKILDIAELLSVQAHPPGNSELYVIIHADPGATIRLGFRHNIDRESLRRELHDGRAAQQALLRLLRPDTDQLVLQDLLAPALADRDGPLDDVMRRLQPLCAPGAGGERLAAGLHQLKATYWHVLDLLNEIPVRPGQIIHNATPARICASTGSLASAEVHALGNPERREILMLEIRRPGVTFRAWDNVRFPVRDIDIDRTLAALHLGATSPEEFEVTAVPHDELPGVDRLVAGDSFVVDLVRPQAGRPVGVPAGRFQTLHVITGEVAIVDEFERVQRLAAGESAVVPAPVASYRVASDGDAELIRVCVPDPPA